MDFPITLQKMGCYQRLQIIATQSLQLINFYKVKKIEVFKQRINSYFCHLSIVTLLLIRLYSLLLLTL